MRGAGAPLSGWWRGTRPAAAAPAPMEGDGLPLFFFHVPKTAGTSVAAAMRRMFPRRSVVTVRGALSPGFVRRAIAAGLPPGGLIHGHVGHGAAELLRGRTRMVTLLRDPVDHCVSNYLFIRADPNNPQVRDARRMGLSDFVRANPYYAVFQAASLDVGLHAEPPASTAALLERLPAVRSFLEGMFLVGTVARADAFLAGVARAVGRTAPPPPLRCLRRSRARAGERERLRKERLRLEADAELAPLFAAERAVYDTARRLEETAAGRGLPPARPCPGEAFPPTSPP